LSSHDTGKDQTLQLLSQSLRKSGLCRRGLRRCKEARTASRRRNPFVNQVFVVRCTPWNYGPAPASRNPFVNQVFVVRSDINGYISTFARRNPFVNQVFVVTVQQNQLTPLQRSQSLRKSGLCRLSTAAE